MCFSSGNQTLPSGNSFKITDKAEVYLFIFFGTNYKTTLLQFYKMKGEGKE